MNLWKYVSIEQAYFFAVLAATHANGISGKLSFWGFCLSFDKILLEFSKKLLELVRIFPWVSGKPSIYWIFDKNLPFYSKKLLKVTFVVQMVVNFNKLAVSVLENFRFLEFFWKYCLSFKEKLLEFEFFSPWVLGRTAKK